MPPLVKTSTMTLLSDEISLKNLDNLEINDEPRNNSTEQENSEVKKEVSPAAAKEPEIPVQDTTDNDSAVGVEENSSSHDPGDGDQETSTEQKRCITVVRDDDGEEFMLPWIDCKTWEGMENLIKMVYDEYSESDKGEIEEGKYKLRVDGQIVFKHHWENLATPDWTVNVALNCHISSDEEDTPEVDDTPVVDEGDPDKNDDDEGKYDVKVRYTVDFYRKDDSDLDEFVNSKSSDTPIMSVKPKSKGQTLPVLEEKTDMDVRGFIKARDLHIYSSFLMNALRAVIRYVSEAPYGDESDSLKTGKFSYPYRDLFHHREELRNYKKQTAGPRENHTEAYNAECDKHIDLLLKYLDNEPTMQIQEVEARWEKKAPTTSFAKLWLLMKPGSDVYVQEDGQLNAYVIDSASDNVKHFTKGLWSNRVESHKVRVWNLVFDGNVIKRRSIEVEVPVFDNERTITSLPLFPTRFQDQADDGLRRKQLITRGEKVFRFAKGPAFLEYTGSGLRPGWKKYNRARVVVEHESQPWDRTEFDNSYEWKLGGDYDEIRNTERARTPHCECSNCTDLDGKQEVYTSGTFTHYDKIDPKSSQTPTEHQHLLCMSHMFGFILKDRMYDLLDVSGLADPRIAEDAIDRLVMRPEANKDTVKAIVQTYTDSQSQAELFSADFIHGKGEGQVFLLHGPPGTGKTLTAESVAEFTKRPLLSITAADLGHDPVDLERNLLRFFKDANNWDAIVLLDEADVYLERRSANDLRRNSIVSIFLRALDYFQGILFLTTNRVGHFDEAFMSRIHIAIGYESLDDEAREQIWNNLFRKLKDDHKHGGPDIRYEYDAKEYVKRSKEIKTLEWNGREIRNAFQSAVALAIYDSKVAREKGARDEDSIPEVKEKHLKQIADMSTAFKSYMISTHQGIKDADMAFKLGIRDDRFGSMQMSG